MSEAESRLTATELRALRRFNTPTISNAIELFNVRPRHTGFLPHYDPLPAAGSRARSSATP